MQVVGRVAVAMGPKGVLSTPVIEIEANRIRSAESQPDGKGDLQVDGLILSGFISTHTHLHGLVAYGHLIPPPAGFWPFLRE
ncbi:MAG: hypothetical protein GTO63_00665 [Anaerolineae bacterium]|nr:hypothetical protein [Anaerolineae bacterium]NIN93518.1 hypothetical protein [Anaerolineae bacterium]NIQ76592.1 hypothetical protein [Anaerolineae bacterium]